MRLAPTVSAASPPLAKTARAATQDYNRRVQEAQQDRQKEFSTFDQQFARHMSTADKRDFEAAQERGLDMNAYVQRQAVGANLADPAASRPGRGDLSAAVGRPAKTSRRMCKQRWRDAAWPVAGSTPT